MDNKRRKFLKIAGLSALAGIGAPGIIKLTADKAVASSGEGHEAVAKTAGEAAHTIEEASGIRLGMVIDMRKFSARPEMLDRAIAACHQTHNVPQIKSKKSEIKWIWKTPFENAFTDQSSSRLSKMVRETDFAVLCNHCDNPPCVRACPTKATFKIEENGIVAMDYHRCIGCRFCMAACPYGSRSFNWENPRPHIKKYNPEFPTRMRGVVEKCNFCADRLVLGKEPACVEAVKEIGAMTFGDLNDPKSEVSQILDSEFTIQRKSSLGTKPSVFYIV